MVAVELALAHEASARSMSAGMRGSSRRRVSVAVARLTSARAAWSSCRSSHGERERLLEQRDAALVVAAAEQRGADVGQRVRERLVVAEPAGERRGALAERDRLVVALVQHRSCDWALSAIASSRLSGNASSTAIAWSPTSVASGPCPAHQSSRESQRRSSPARSSSPALVQRDQRAARLDRAVRRAAQVGLVGDALERLRRRRRTRQRRLPLLERLPVAARGGRGAGGGGREAADRVVVARAAGVVGEPGRIGVAGGLQRGAARGG